VYILSGLALGLGILWLLSAIAWGRLRRPEETESAFPQDGLASRESRSFDYNRQDDNQRKAVYLQ
jgi:hypothetical protein